jgi:archaellum component FlaG (FlaF/FlaG flagellin family)
MGAETSSTHMIFFIVATALAVAVSGIMTTAVYDVSGKLTIRGKLMGDALTTEIVVINDPGSVPNNPVIIYVKNIGQKTLNQSLVNMIIDGTPRTYTVALLNGATTWNTGSVAQYTFSGLNLANGDHRVRVSVENGAFDDFKWRR